MLIKTPAGSFRGEVEAFDLPPTFPVVLPLCRELKIAETVDRFCPMAGGDHLTHGQVAEFLILHLLQSPDRLPLYQLQTWAAEHNVHKLYGRAPEEFNDDRVGRMLEALAEAIPEVETQVVTRTIHRYRIPTDIIHWDLTSLEFTGAYEKSELICRGWGHGTLHQRQLQVSLHTTDEAAIPIRHETLAGNLHQAPLAPDMLKDLQTRLPTSQFMIVSDRAGISYENILDYRRSGHWFLGPLQISDPRHKQQLAAVPLEQFTPLDYHPMNRPQDTYSYYPTTLELKPQGKQAPLQVEALFIYSSQRHEHDIAQRQKALTRALERLQEIGGFLNKRRYAKADYAQEHIAKAVPEALASIIHADLQGHDGALTLGVSVDEEALAEAAKADGRYVLVFSMPSDKSPEEMFMTYRRHGSIEQRFRNLFSELAIQPVWLHKQERILGLAAIIILALIVYTVLELVSQRAGLSSEHYHKLTARATIRLFGHVHLKQVQIEDLPPQRELVLSADQAHIISQLRFPDPVQYLDST